MALEVRPPVNEYDIAFLMLHLIRLPNFLKSARYVLSVSHFTEQKYGLIYAALLSLLERNENISKLTLENRIRSFEGDIDPKTVEEACKFVHAAFSIDPNDLCITSAADILQRFIRDRAIVSIRVLNDLYSSGTPHNLDQQLNDLVNLLKRADSVLVDTPKPIIEKDISFDPLKIRSTGIPFIDAMMNGGHAPGEVYGILGPTGAGKSTLGVQLCVEGAKLENISMLNGEPDWGVWVYFTYETPVKHELQIRMISCMAQIDRSRLERIRSVEELSTSDSLLDYEKELFGATSDIPGEFERFNAARPVLMRHIYAFDFTGSDGSEAGSRGVDDIHIALERVRDVTGRPIKGVVVDYVGEAVDRIIVSQYRSFDHKRHLIRIFARDMIAIARQFECPVWLIHQLAGKVGSYSPSKVASHTDAAECKNFADPLWFAFVLGSRDKNSGCSLISCTKARRATLSDAHIVQLEGNLCRFVSAESRYTLDPVTRKIVEKKLLETVSPPAETFGYRL